MKKYILFAILVMFTYISYAQTTYKLDKDVSYVSSSETDSYKLERCKVDIYYPENKDKFSTLIWFHGGGMEMGEKYIPEEIKNKGIAVVSVNYRLSP
ncbi:MAG: carboxylesterase family protein, partial [Bacteroidales bacterium]